MDIVTLALAKKYTEESLKGAGALKGDKGDQGPAGTTPSIGANGNWFIGEVDTGMPTSISSQYFYNSLNEAITACNNDSLSSVNGVNAKIIVTRFGPGNYRIDLLEDVGETTNISVSCNVYLSLNGKILSFTNNGSGLTYSNGIYCVIDGRVPGSKMTKSAMSSTGKEWFVSSLAKTLKVLGGTYEIEVGSSASQCCVFVSYGKTADIIPGYDSMTKDEVINWLNRNKKNLSSIEIDSCSLISKGGKNALAVAGVAANIEIKGSTIEMLNSIYQQGCLGQYSYLTVEHTDISLSYSGASGLDKNRFYGFYLVKASSRLKKVNIVVSVLCDSIKDTLALYNYDGYCEVEDSIIDFKSDITESQVVVSAVASTWKTILVNCIIKGISKYTRTVGARAIGGELRLKSCHAEGIESAVRATTDAIIYVENSELTGYIHGGLVTENNAMANLKNCSLTGGTYSGELLAELSSSLVKDCALINSSNNVYMDNCTFHAGENVPDVMQIGYAVGSSANFSNCTVSRSGSQLIKMGHTDSKVYIGDGNNFTSDIVDETKGDVVVTSELYRYLEDTEQCSGKDLKVYFDYINKSITNQLSAIVDGEVS